MSIELVIFDCDGVLIDSEIIVCRICAEELSAHGLPYSYEEIAQRFLGIPSAPMYQTIEEERGVKIPEELRSRIRGRIRQEIENDVEAVPGVHDTLAALSQDVCVASSSGLEYLRIALGKVGLYERFAPHVFSAQQVARGKPAPDVFLFAAQEMGVDCATCLVIEDSAAGVAGALAAGMQVVGFTGGAHCTSDHCPVLERQGAHHLIADMTELPGLIGELR